MIMVKIYDRGWDTPIRSVPCNKDEAEAITNMADSCGLYTICTEADNPDEIMIWLKEQYETRKLDKHCECLDGGHADIRNPSYCLCGGRLKRHGRVLDK